MGPRSSKHRWLSRHDCSILAAARVHPIKAPYGESFCHRLKNRWVLNPEIVEKFFVVEAQQVLPTTEAADIQKQSYYIYVVKKIIIKTGFIFAFYNDF